MTESEIIEFVTGFLPEVDKVVASEADGALEVSWGGHVLLLKPGRH